MATIIFCPSKDEVRIKERGLRTKNLAFGLPAFHLSRLKAFVEAIKMPLSFVPQVL